LDVAFAMTSEIPMPMACAGDGAALMRLQVNRKYQAAPQITVFELTPPPGTALPAFEAGAHVVVLTPSGATRRYSLCNAPGEVQRYVLAIQRDAQGLGGSVSMVDGLQEGDSLPVSRPENYFPLAADGTQALFIAGGIGITPILAMVHSLKARGCAMHLIYCTREPACTAFLDELTALAAAGVLRLTLHHSYGVADQRMDLSPWLAQAASGTHVYCCGPRSLMQSVRDLTRHWPPAQLHFEDFGTRQNTPAPMAPDRSFVVCLSRQNRRVAVAADESILAALRAQGLAVPSSCESGTCGACRTRLLAGEAEHRDYVLDEDDHHKDIMICVSRARSPELVLDL
jgi:phthalate 4,5-dioxygenase reductase component